MENFSKKKTTYLYIQYTWGCPNLKTKLFFLILIKSMEFSDWKQWRSKRCRKNILQNVMGGLIIDITIRWFRCSWPNWWCKWQQWSHYISISDCSVHNAMKFRLGYTNSVQAHVITLRFAAIVCIFHIHLIQSEF